MTTDKENNKTNHNAAAPEATEPVQERPVAAPIDDDAASAEEMEAFIRSRKEQRQKHTTPNTDHEEPLSVAAEPFDNSMDSYLEPDPTLPKVAYKEPLFLSRGCNHCPESYVPVSETELRSCCKVGSCNWMKDIRRPADHPFDCVEVRFKNNRKDFFRLPDGIDVSDGDVVAVEGIPGHDVGIVSITGEACRIQMKKKHVNPESDTIKKLFRRAKVSDIERWCEAIKEENRTLLKTRHIAEELGLQMKVNDVEYQGDRSKAIFYYTADDRVDFRNLIKVLAEQFHVRIEMKQIGVRQEAGKVGGIGTCGRELCCSTWLTNFKSVTTSVAKAQQILPNPQKLAGQCGKLKCCLNFEYEVYVDALKQFPPAGTPIRFQKALALYKKTDVFKGIMWYAYEGQNDLYALTADTVKQLIEMNRREEYPTQIEDYQVELMSTAALAQESDDAEFERELSLMADDNATTASNSGAADKERRDNKSRHNRDSRDSRDGNHPNNERRYDRKERGDRGERNDRGDRGDRNDRNRETREVREPRDMKEMRDRKDRNDNRRRQPRNEQRQKS